MDSVMTQLRRAQVDYMRRTGFTAAVAEVTEEEYHRLVNEDEFKQIWRSPQEAVDLIGELRLWGMTIKVRAPGPVLSGSYPRES